MSDVSHICHILDPQDCYIPLVREYYQYARARTPEGSCFMLKGAIGDFDKYIGSDTWQKCPIGNTRTVSLFNFLG